VLPQDDYVTCDVCMSHVCCCVLFSQRNPEIKLYGLPWTFPGWVGGGVFDPFYNRTATVRYIMNWINGAWQFHGLKINYIGVCCFSLHC